NLQEALRDLNGREPQPDFLAEVREELQREGPGLAERLEADARNAPCNLTDEQRAVLRLILLGAPGLSRPEVALEFRRRTGRDIGEKSITAHRKSLGLGPARIGRPPAVIDGSSPYDHWDCHVPTML